MTRVRRDVAPCSHLGGAGRRLRGALLPVVAMAVGAGVSGGCDRSGAPPPADLTATLGAADSGYARALEPRDFSFPADHGPHPDFRTEWWYFTGNLEADDGRRFGFELTFFRSALSPDPVPRGSAFGATQAYMAHFALTDVAANRFTARQRFERGAAGLAGAQGDPFRVHVDDWSVRAVPRDSAAELPGTSETPALRLEAASGDVAVSLLLGSAGPPVLNGDGGLSRKGPEPGNASYYYSIPDMPARGFVRTPGGEVRVTGHVWMDREWGSGQLSRRDAGWDWLALRLDDGSAVMIYRLRRRGGGTSPYSGGTWIGPDGARRTLAADAFALRATGRWRSPTSGTSYPSGWELEVPAEGVRVRIEPEIRDQELDLDFRYWEGAVRVEGRVGDRQVRGAGYVELTGY